MMRILIAEDDRTSRNLLAAVLDKQGHQVVATCDGEQAWAALSVAAAPRLVVLDWMMPGTDGLEVLRRLREREHTSASVRPVYVIMLTTLDDKQHVARGLDAGADDYLAKPFDPLELRARVAVGERLLARDNALREAMTQIRTLRGLIPICMHCKRVRDDGDYWREVEEYVATNTGAKFSHALCPVCCEQYYPEVAVDDTGLEPDDAS